MYLDQRFAVDYPEPDHSLEFAARLLAACPSALANLKSPKEIFEKTLELATMFHDHIHRNDPKPKYDLSKLTEWPSDKPEKTD
jgi:hypothetical protein